MRPSLRMARLSVGLLLIGVLCAPALAQLPGTVTRNDGKSIAFNNVRWVASRKVYALEVPRGTGGTTISVELKLADVQEIKVQQPANARALAEAVTKGQADAAIPGLKKIVEDYTMLQYDLTMGRWLAEAYMQKGMSDETIRMVEDVLRLQERGYGQPIAVPYWQALLKEGKTSKLDSVLKKSIEFGTRETAARAQNMRGDMAKKAGDYEGALKGGYLRTWLLFRNVRDTQPEALAKAAECFEELNQTTHAEKMRNELLAKYPNSEYAKKAR